MARKPRVGLVLGGGGMMGMAFHAGVLLGLSRVSAWDPQHADLVVGTSAGAFSGAELLAGFSPVDLAARRGLGELSPTGLRLQSSLGPEPRFQPHYKAPSPHSAFAGLGFNAQGLKGKLAPSLALAATSPTGRLSTEWVRGAVDWLYPMRRWPETPFYATAINMEQDQRVLLGREEASYTVGEAVAASCAVPGIFAPVAIKGNLHIDGGCWSPTNADVAAGAELDLVIISSPMTGPVSRKHSDFLIRRAASKRLAQESKLLKAAGSELLILEPSREDLEILGSLAGFQAFDDKRSPEIISQVEESAYRYLQTQKALRLLVS